MQLFCSLLITPFNCGFTSWPLLCLFPSVDRLLEFYSKDTILMSKNFTPYQSKYQRLVKGLQVHSACRDGAQNRKLSYKWHQSRNPPQDNYTLDKGEAQEENVMAAGCANLQESV